MGERSIRRAGRLQQLAYDDTPLHSSAPDLDARVGWLLAVSRLYGDDLRYADGGVFVEALAEHDVVASRSLVSRWESGDLAPPYSALRAYEEVLDLGPGALTGLVAYLRATLPAKSRPLRPMLNPGAAGFDARLDALLDRAEDGAATAADWQQLGWHLAAVPLLHLRQESWRRLARSLVSTASRAVGPAQLLLHNAVTDVATVRRSHSFLLDAIEDYLGDPDAQVLTTPFSLLQRIPGSRAGNLVLDLFEEPPTPPLMMMSVSVVTQMVLRDDFTPEQRARLGMQVLRQWRDNPERSARRLAELIAVLPEGLRSPLTDAADRSGQDALSYAVRTGEARVRAAARLSQEVADGARRRTPGRPVHAEDRMLPRLVREALFHREQERRHGALLVVAASPFAAGVCDELLDLLRDVERSADVRLTASWAVRYLADDTHRMRILRLVDTPDELVSGPVTLALGHLGFDEVSDQVLRNGLGHALDNRSRAAVYALGMTGSPGLTGLARSATVPDWQRRAAAWWQRQGPAVRH